MDRSSQGHRMLAFMASKGLVFTLEDEADSPDTLTRWEYSPDGELLNSSRLDFLLVSGNIADITSRSITWISPISDHMLIDVVVDQKKPHKQEWSIMPSTLRDPEWKLVTSMAIDSHIKIMDFGTLLSPTQRWRKLKKLIKEVSKKYEKEKYEKFQKEKIEAEKNGIY
ncbi:hypothetical protein DSO57_1018271 [Entomophthora muscae]|uniref:Uncharacterized protein n=1 Tax=Entomophthora muscae TaxID=34485 RepID=A0ACC2ST67_9FUNG|nr:hypothetical protein DSO57_1018271 [Entomophthora muscae]